MEKNVDQEATKCSALRSTNSDTELSERTEIELSVDPEEACFPQNGAGKTDHMVVNFTKTRLALKVNIPYPRSQRWMVSGEMQQQPDVPRKSGVPGDRTEKM